MVDLNDGLSLIEAGVIAGSLSAILVFLFLVMDRIIKPFLLKWGVISKKWDNVEKIDEIMSTLNAVKDQITPTNGDQRSISDRVDTAKHNAANAVTIAEQNSAEINSLSKEFTDYKKVERYERRERQRQHDEDRIAVNSRLTNLETNVAAIQHYILTGKLPETNG